LSSETPDANQQDLPWNDSPADSEAPPGATEPAPAEVTSDEDGDDVVDTRTPRFPDIYQRDTLDQRLAEELPDQLARGGEGPVQLVAPAAGGGDVEVADSDPEDLAGVESDLPAEESAVHVTDDI
jgi:hypothetical protein